MNEACYFCKFDHCDICTHGKAANQVITPRNLSEQSSGDGITQTDLPFIPHRNEDWKVSSGCNATDTSVALKNPTDGVQVDRSTAPNTVLYPGFPKGTPFGASIRQSSGGVRQ